MYSALKATMEYKTGPPIANLRCRKMAWQLEENWCWHIVFTDNWPDPSGPAWSRSCVLFRVLDYINCIVKHLYNGNEANGPNL
jgi:hypothetical protein